MKLRELRAIVQKADGEPYWLSRIAVRPVSVFVSWAFLHVGVSADATTLLSLAIGLVGAVMLCWYQTAPMLLGIACLVVWYVLDHVDGELARYEIQVKGRRPSLAGAYLDEIVHRWVQPLAHAALGIALARHTGSWGYSLLGLAAASAYVGWTRGTAAGIVLEAIVLGRVGADHPRLGQVASLKAMVPSQEATTGLQQIVDLAKRIRLVFAFPGFILLLAAAIFAEMVVWPDASLQIGGIRWSPLSTYLFLTATVAVAQNIAGTWLVTHILRQLP